MLRDNPEVSRMVLHWQELFSCWREIDCHPTDCLFDGAAAFQYFVTVEKFEGYVVSIAHSTFRPQESGRVFVEVDGLTKVQRAELSGLKRPGGKRRGFQRRLEELDAIVWKASLPPVHAAAALARVLHDSMDKCVIGWNFFRACGVGGPEHSQQVH